MVKPKIALSKSFLDNLGLQSFFRFFFMLSLGAVIWTGAVFGLHMWRYLSFSASAPAAIQKWSFEEKKPGRFALVANYKFCVGQGVYTNRHLFAQPIYQSAYRAKEHMALWEKLNWVVWYSPFDPTKASLEKRFPVKQGVHLAISLVLALYFLFLPRFCAQFPK